MSRKRVLGGVALLGAVLVLAACSGPDANYVSNAKAGLYLKIPTDWQTVDLQAGDVKPDGQLAVAEAWRVGIDSAAEPLRSHFEDSAPAPDEPIGVVEVFPIDPAQLSTAPSLQLLRDLATGRTTDPSTGQTVTPTVDVLRDDEVTMSSGHWGLQTTVQSTGDSPVRLEQLAMFDPAIHRLYRVTIKCTASCFDAHSQEIESIFDSLTLRGTS
jgi:hypothetical protein